MKIASFDPGGSTGIATVSTDDFRTVLTAELVLDNHHTQLWTFLNLYQPDKVVTEGFDYRMATTKDGSPVPGIELISRNYIGVLELWCQLNDVPIVIQSPMIVKGDKNFWHDGKLNCVGIQKSDGPHRMDAIRHLLYFVTFDLKDQYYVRLWRDKAPLMQGDISVIHLLSTGLLTTD